MKKNSNCSTSGKRYQQSATSQIGTFDTEEWYHGMLPREDITKLLVEQGHFLVRLTEPKINQGLKFCLSVRWNKKSHHFIIKHDGKDAPKFYIERFQFDSLVDLIQFYVTRKIPVTEKSGVCLITAVPRQDWELHHEHIQLGKMLGEGAFGAVHAGILTTKDGTTKKVAVKVHKGKAVNKDMIKEICKEARTMRRFKHPNVVAFYGVAIEHEPIMIIMELVSGGALDSYLVKCAATISVSNRIAMCFDAAKGIEYLHDKSCIHRDIAARNCLVNEGKIKISDFGLSRELSNHSKVFKLENLKQKLPIRWLSPETLITASYTFKSDVFSYGILMWEIFSSGKEPYSGMTAAEVNVQVKQGYRMAAPENMPNSVKAIMIQHCWSQQPDERWNMTMIRKALEDIIQGNSAKKSRIVKLSEMKPVEP